MKEKEILVMTDGARKLRARVDLDAGIMLYDDTPTETAIGELYDDDFLQLANTIILQAVEDLAFGYKQMLIVYKEKRFFPTKDEFERAHGISVAKTAQGCNWKTMTEKMCLYYETLDFFESEWGKFLMRNIKVPTEDIVRHVENIVEEKMSNKKKFQAKGYNSNRIKNFGEFFKF